RGNPNQHKYAPAQALIASATLLTCGGGIHFLGQEDQKDEVGGRRPWGSFIDRRLLCSSPSIARGSTSVYGNYRDGKNITTNTSSVGNLHKRLLHQLLSRTNTSIEFSRLFFRTKTQSRSTRIGFIAGKTRGREVACELKYAGQTCEFQEGTIHRLEFPQTNYESTVVSIARVGGRIYCVGASCSHYSAPLYHGVVDAGLQEAPSGGGKSREAAATPTVTCPWHDAAFDLRTGRPVRGPVLDAIPVYKVVLDKGSVYVDIPTLNEPDFVLPKMVRKSEQVEATSRTSRSLTPSR
ncbi:unnamed protein product, partial [Amoebophrya sp. A25]